LKDQNNYQEKSRTGLVIWGDKNDYWKNNENIFFDRIKKI
jgi:hypothetical protein